MGDVAVFQSIKVIEDKNVSPLTFHVSGTQCLRAKKVGARTLRLRTRVYLTSGFQADVLQYNDFVG